MISVENEEAQREDREAVNIEQLLPFLRIEDLPRSIRALAQQIGLAAIMKLIQRYGGTRLYLPKTFSPKYELPQLVGLIAARAIVGHFNDDRPHIPLASHALQRARNRAICVQAGNISTSRLARQYGLHERSIYNILARSENGAAIRPAAISGRGREQGRDSACGTRCISKTRKGARYK